MESLLVQVDPDLKRRLKLRAIKDNVSLRQVVTSAAIIYLGDEIKDHPEPVLPHHACKKCNYEWDSRQRYPKMCPMCKSYRWQEDAGMIKEHICTACHYTWSSRKEFPSACPACRSTSWNPNSQVSLYNVFHGILKRASRGDQPMYVLANRMRTTVDRIVNCIHHKEVITQAHIDALTAAIAKGPATKAELKDDISLGR